MFGFGAAGCALTPSYTFSKERTFLCRTKETNRCSAPAKLIVKSLKILTDNLKHKANAQVDKSLYFKIIHKYKDKTENKRHDLKKMGQEKLYFQPPKISAYIHSSFTFLQ